MVALGKEPYDEASLEDRVRVADQDDVADEGGRAPDARDVDEAGILKLLDRIEELVNEVDGLGAAMEHRSVIEQAKGVVMHTLGCSADAAFAVLVAQSQAENRKLREIAEELAAAQDRPQRPNF